MENVGGVGVIFCSIVGLYLGNMGVIGVKFDEGMGKL